MKIASLKAGYAALNAADWVGNLPYPLLQGVELKVRRLFSPEWVALAAKLGEEKTDLSEAANDARIERECLARACLVDWKGIDDVYSGDLAVSLLADPQAGPSFRSAILWAAQRHRERVLAQVEADVKNSSAPSSGRSTGVRKKTGSKA